MDDMNQNEQDDTSRPTTPRPLGYWLRAVDGLLTREFATALETEGVTRRDWMLLNVLSGDIDAPGLRERLARKGKRLRGLEERGWVQERGDGTWALTDLGRTEKERLGGIVDGIRSRVLDAVGEEQFAALTASLEAIARELGWDESAAGERGFGFGGFGRPGFGPGPGFGGRPGPFGRDFRYGFGPNLHRGFAPGRPGHPAERFDEPYRGGQGDDPHGHHGHEGWGGHPHHGHEGWGGHAHHDHHGHPHHHGHHGHHGRRAQQAYERGFDAGFSRGRDAGAA